MDLSATSKNRHYARIVRYVAALAALFFAIVAIVAPLHQHGSGESLLQKTSVQQRLSHSSVALTASAHPMQSMNSGDCPLCDWLATAMVSGATVAWEVTVAFSALALLVLSVRLAALCTSPAPRRGLRAPPFAVVA